MKHIFDSRCYQLRVALSKEMLIVKINARNSFLLFNVYIGHIASC